MEIKEKLKKIIVDIASIAVGISEINDNIAIQAVTKQGILNVSKRLPMKSSPFVLRRQPPKQSLKKAQRLIPRLSGFAIGLTVTIHPFPNTTIW